MALPAVGQRARVDRRESHYRGRDRRCDRTCRHRYRPRRRGDVDPRRQRRHLGAGRDRAGQQRHLRRLAGCQRRPLRILGGCLRHERDQYPRTVEGVMTRKGCDYAWGRPSIDSLKAAGITFACRYLSYGPAVGGKNLELGEAARLRSAGIDVVSNWEWYGDWSHDYSGGYTTGRRHALDADPMHRDRGGPAGRPIYFSTDFNPTTAQLPTVGDYARGNASAISLARTGAYGGYRAIKYLFDNHLITWGWQTYAWSTFSDDPSRPELAYLHWDPRAQLRQTKNGVLIGGGDCDIDYST